MTSFGYVVDTAQSVHVPRLRGDAKSFGWTDRHGGIYLDALETCWWIQRGILTVVAGPAPLSSIEDEESWCSDMIESELRTRSVIEFTELLNLMSVDMNVYQAYSYLRSFGYATFQASHPIVKEYSICRQKANVAWQTESLEEALIVFKPNGQFSKRQPGRPFGLVLCNSEMKPHDLFDLPLVDASFDPSAGSDQLDAHQVETEGEYDVPIYLALTMKGQVAFYCIQSAPSSIK